MKIFIKTLFVSVFALLLIADISFAREYKARKKIPDYTVEMSIDRNPPIVDKNTLSLEIKDALGKHVTDAKVLVNYYMPPMPGMTWPESLAARLRFRMDSARSPRIATSESATARMPA